MGQVGLGRSLVANALEICIGNYFMCKWKMFIQHNDALFIQISTWKK